MSDGLPKTMNGFRSQWAGAAIGAFARETFMVDEPEETKVQDLLCDLMHWCASKNIAFDTVLRVARDHYEHERKTEQ